MPRSIRILIAKIVVSFVSACLTFLAVELGARAYDRLYRQTPNLDMFEFRQQQPPPYRDAPYYSKDFVVESFKQPGGFDIPKGTRLVIPRDYEGKWFNIAGGLRFTEGQPETFRHTVYVLGGSTVYSGEVPDAFTLPSQLQLLFTEHYGDRYRVQNYGMTTVTSSQELERLRTIKLLPGDIVVFYDGVNDVFQEIYYARPAETMVERNRRAMEEFSHVERLLIRLSEHSVFIKNWTSPINYVDVPSHLRDREELAVLVHSLQGRYRRNIISARKYAHAHRANFFHFLQPNLYTVRTPTTYEKKIRQNPNLYAPPGMDGAFELAYPLLREVSRNLRSSEEMNAFDLTDVLDEREPGQEHYLDICHVTHAANLIIASAMFEEIAPSLDTKLPGSN